MTKTFRYIFSTAINPGVPTTISFSIAEIAGAAVMEIAQLSSASVAFGSFLSEITSSSSYFEWSSRLGEVRETRTALSGLFGRFVARAFLAREAQCSKFWPITSKTMAIPIPSGAQLMPAPGTSGDLPDWACNSPLAPSGVIIAEAKGSHDRGGYSQALERAKGQVERVDLISGTTTLTVKRYAIATRWAIHGDPHLTEPWLAVHDPVGGQRNATSPERRQIATLISSMHFAALARGMGYERFATWIEERPLEEDRRSGISELDRVIFEADPFPQGVKGLMAIITPGGLTPLTRDEVILGARIFRRFKTQRAMALVIPEDSVSDKIPAGQTMRGYPFITGRQGDEFWDRVHRFQDGTWLLPIQAMNVRKP